MATATAEKKAEVLGLGDCDNHPGVDAVVVDDGGGAHSVQKFCAECAARK